MTERSEGFLRARSPEHRQHRADAILAAARALARAGVRSVSLTDIAAEVGLHKSALLRYFETREQIFLVLTAEGWTEWAGALRSGLAALAAEHPDAEHPDAEEVDALAELLSRSLAERPLFCDLLAQAPLNLERNVSQDAVRVYKLAALASVEEIATALERAQPRLGPGGGRELVAAVTSLAGSFWQTSHPPPTLAALYAEDPRLGHAVVDFVPRLRRLTAVTIAGLIAVGSG
jgi:AcrR family transcriptional regulator